MLTQFRDLFTPPRHLILLVVATWVGLFLAEKRSESHGIHGEDLNNITYYGLIAFIIGGRISFALQNFAVFAKRPIDIISINPDLFDPVGALAIASIIAFVYIQRKTIPFWNILDSLVPLFAIFTIGLGFSHLAAGTSFGIETDLPWGITLWNANRHPTQIYETLASLLIFGLIWFKKQNPRPGIDFLIFASLSAFSQLIIHAFRADDIIIFNGIKEEQIIAWIILFFCFILMENRLNNTKT